MRTIFHFNCVICGAHPQESKFNNFEWPSSPQQLQDLISSVKWILPNVEKASLASEPFRQEVHNLSDALLGDKSKPLHAFTGKETFFTQQCPLCDTPPGPRPYDKYFHAWFAWNLLSRVQVGNLFYELSALFDRNEKLKYLVPFCKKAINQLGLPICRCGRPTTTLYDSGLCAWCDNASLLDEREEQEKKREEFADFLKSSGEDDIFGIGKEQWKGVLEALARDVREQADNQEHLQIAILAYRFDSILNKIREGHAAERTTCPGDLNIPTIAPTLQIPEGHESICLACLDLPREALETIAQFRITNIPEEIAVLLEQKGLLEYGTPEDVTFYLDRIRMSQLREISDELGAGYARSKHDLINKILLTASYEKIAEIFPVFQEKWIKKIEQPFSNLEEGWYDHIESISFLLQNFLEAKFNSVQLQRLAQKNNKQLFVQLDYECPSSCKIRAENFSMGKTISLHDIPPWFPGCGCSLDRRELSWVDEEHPPIIGSTVKIEKPGDWATLRPNNLMGKAVESSNREYMLFWKSGMQFRNKFEPGYYIVIEKDVIKALGKIDRPFYGKIANNGTFIISDQRTFGEIGNVIWVLNIQGEVIYRHLYTNSIDCVTISENGKYAACYESSIQVFDLEAQRLISQFSLKGRCSSIEIDESARSICIVVDGSGNKVKFTLAGECLDKATYHKIYVDNIYAGNAFGYQLIQVVKDSLLNDDKLDYQNLETLLRKALEKRLSTNTRGVVYRMLGEFAEATGHLAKAVDMYTTALQYAPKLPIRKKLKALRESIGSRLD